MSDKDGFARRLTALRERAGLTQAALADRAGLSRQAIGKLERGEREPTLETAVRLAAALGVPVTAFVPDAPDNTAQPPAESPQPD